jgi:hypothetical protein
MTLLVLHGRDASAQGSCQDAFAAWAKLSERHVRAVQQSRGDARGACLASEAVRKELLDELIRTRARCTESSSDPSSQQARTILAINENFIVSLGVCPVEGASAAPSAAPGWTTKSAPPPPPSAPKAVARPCLQISHPKQEHYTLTNRHCAGKAVLAIIETRGTAGKVECKAYTIHQALALRSPDADKPYVNHECVLNQDRCSKEHLGRMFPECDW